MSFKIWDRNPSGAMRRRIEQHSNAREAARAVAILNGHEKKNGRADDRYYSEPDTGSIKLGELNLPDWYYDAYKGG